MEKKTHFVRDFLQNSIGNSSTSTTCNPIYNAGTILQLQITMEFCRPHMHEKQLKPHLQCGTDPRMIRAWSENDPTTHETVSQPSHRRGRSSRFGDGLCRRKFRSQTSDNMERWKAEQGRGREKRKIRREKIRRERVRRQKIQMREKVGKSRNTVFFQWFVAPEGRKVGSLKRSQLATGATGAMKNCTPLWREAHFEVKTPQC